jgi:carboxyl-terminal processing protease
MKPVYKKIASVIASLLLLVATKGQDKMPPALTTAEKLFGLSHIWSEAKYNLVYFNKLTLDWDSLYKATIPHVLETTDTKSYYDVLRRFTAYLGDGHTSVWYPNHFYQNEFAYAPLATDIIQDRVFITGVLNDSLAAAGWKKGMEILKVNGRDVHEYAQQNIAPFEGASTSQGLQMMVYKLYLLNGPVNEPLHLTLKDVNGKILEKTMLRSIKRQPASTIQFKVLPGKIGLLSINGFTDPGFYTLFDSLYKHILQTDALLVDLRENVGGDGSQGEYLMKHLTTSAFTEPQISAVQYNPLLKVWGQTSPAFYTISPGMVKPFTDRPIYTKPVVLLVSKQTVSAAEDFAMQFDAIGRGAIIGQPTAGSTGQPMLSSLPGGGTFRVCVRKDTYPNGKEFVGVGIQPTIMVAENADAFQKGRDLVLEKALQVLHQKQ